MGLLDDSEDLLDDAAEDVLGRDGVVSRDHLDADDANAGVVLGAVVDTVTKVAQPGLKLGAVVLLDEVAVRDDVGDAADGGPLARHVEEGHVDVGVVLEVVGLAGLAVAVEEEVDAAVLLWVVCEWLRLGI